MKLRSALLLVVAATVCALSGLISPRDAAASIDVVNNWPGTPTIVDSSTASPLTGKFIPGIGTNRLMLVVIATRYASGTPTFTVTYGGQAVVNTGTISAATNTAQVNKIWVGYLNEAGIAAGAAGNKVLSIADTNAANRTSLYASVSVYNGVDQTTPFSGAISSATAGAASLALTLPLTGNAGKTGNTGLAVYFSNWYNQTQSTPSAGYTELKEYTSTNVNLSNNIKATIGVANESITSGASGSTVGVAAGVSLNPVINTGINYQKIATCGDCHSSPPQDGSARNVPPGLFPGSHEKHSGQQDYQYALVCTTCHYNTSVTSPGLTNMTGLHHATGFKNISGSGLPRNRYNGGPSIAISDSSTLTFCSNVSCHSTGRAANMGTLNYPTTPQWGTASGCLICHAGRASAQGIPARTTTGGFTLSTTHSQHLKYPAASVNCQICHSKTVTDAATLKAYTGVTRHLNGKRDVTFTGVTYGSYTSFKSTDAGSSSNSKVCTNVSCHGGSTRSAWTSSAVNSDNTCAHCHGIAGTVSGTDKRAFAPGFRKAGTSTDQITSTNDVRVGAHFKHLSSVYMRNIKCNECHTVPSSPFDAGHTDSARYNSQTLNFAQASSATITIGVTAPAIPAKLTYVFTGYTNGTPGKAATCSSVYCHGNRMKTGDTSGSYRKPYWNYSAMINYTDKANACGRCHGNPPRAGSAAPTHVNYTAASKKTVTCFTCHGSVVNSTGAIINKDLHINGQVNATGGHAYPYPGATHASTAGISPWGTCSCHNTSATGVTYAAWVASRTGTNAPNCTTCHVNGLLSPSGTNSCYDCHGATNINGQPNGSLASFPNYSGSHPDHINIAALTCTSCHNGYGSGSTKHGFSNTSTSSTASFKKMGFSVAGAPNMAWTMGAKTCSNSCHGKGSQASPAWGSPAPNLQCEMCHGYRDNAPTWRATDGATTGSHAGNHFSHISSTTYKYAGSYGCKECHSDSIALRTDSVSTAAHFNNASSNKVNWATSPATLIATRFNGYGGNTYNPPAGTCNVYCHGADTATTPASNPARTAPRWGQTGLLNGTHTLGDGASGGNQPGSGDCALCHGYPPQNNHGGTTASSCNSCHGHLNTDGFTFNNPKLHVDGIVQAAGGSCLGCHAGQKGERYGILGQFSSNSYGSHHVQGRAVTNADCFQCHMEAADTTGLPDTTWHKGVSGGKAGVQLVVWGGTAWNATRTGATYISFTANGSRSQTFKLNNVCLGCHNNVNMNANVFGDGKTPSQYAPELRITQQVLAKTSIEARYGNMSTTKWSKYLKATYANGSGLTRTYGINNKEVVVKALSAHGNAINNDMPKSDATHGEDKILAQNIDYTYAGTNKNRNVLCFDCHNSHGSNVAATNKIDPTRSIKTSSYSSATGGNKGGILKSTVAGWGGYNVTYKPATMTTQYGNYSSNLTTTAKMNAGASICNDCHNRDSRIGQAALPRPWSIISTYSSSQSIVGYWSTPYFDNYTIASTKRTLYKAGDRDGSMKDMRTPMGGHFGTSVNGDSVSTHANSPALSTINGLCTPCHDPHGVSLSMPNVASNSLRNKSVPLLKGTWVTSPYREDMAQPLVKRGGGSRYTGWTNIAGQPGYNIDQNTLVSLTAPTQGGAANASASGNKRKQVFAAVGTDALTNHVEKTPASFAGICMECHTQLALTGSATNQTSSKPWRSKERVHQSVAGWAATGTMLNSSNAMHAYTCSKCHAPHVSRLPRLLITNCLDVRHTRRVVRGGAISTATPGVSSANNYSNVVNSSGAPNSGMGAGRFPGGGSRYSGNATNGAVNSSQNNGPWYFQTNDLSSVSSLNTATQYATNCHNTTNASGSTTWNPNTQLWNRKTQW